MSRVKGKESIMRSAEMRLYAGRLYFSKARNRVSTWRERSKRGLKIQKEGERKSLKEVEALGIKGSLNRASSVSHSHLVVRRILFLEKRVFETRLPLRQDVRII